MTLFGGETYDEQLDAVRLCQQLVRVSRLMSDGKWRTLYEIAETTGDPLQSVSARVRDLRKAKFGAHIVDRKRISPGTFAYRVRPGQEPDDDDFLLSLFA
jgi:hypothetical protein